MKIIYTGQIAFSPVQQKKLETKFGKLGKMLDRGGEKGIHVIMTSERHLHRAEITVQVYDHQVAVHHTDVEQFQSVALAADKLEKHILKLRDKWRDTKRRPAAKAKGAPQAAAAKAPLKKAKPSPKASVPADDRRVFRVNHQSKRKPMTVDEAMMEMGDGQEYMVYRDTESDKVHVLVKRRDGHFDLIES